MYANKPEMAKEWQKDTPKGKKLPDKKKAPRKGLGGTEMKDGMPGR